MVTSSMPTIKNLEDVLQEQSTAGRPVKAFVGVNTGRKTLTALLSLFELKEFTDVANNTSKSSLQAQRPLDMKHASSIAKYILKGLISAVKMKMLKHGEQINDSFLDIESKIGKQPYISIPPLVASLRNCAPNGTNLATIAMETTIDRETAAYKIFLQPGDVLWIVDGQHRRKAIELVYDFLDAVLQNHKYPARPFLFPQSSSDNLSSEELSIWAACKEISKSCQVTMEVHLGLNIEEEKQLFHDLNNLGKKIDKSLAFSFDGSNPVNEFIRDVLINDKFDTSGWATHETDKKEWNDEQPGLTRKELVAINSVLFLNKGNINGATPALVDPKKEMAEKFWDFVLSIPGMNEPNYKTKTVAAQPVVLKAIAKLFYDFCFGKNPEYVTPENVEKLLNGLRYIDFSHENRMWNFYHWNEDERLKYELTDLAEYLPDDEDAGNRDVGAYDANGLFRFGAKHNDIFPIIGDMLRWKLGLPARRKTAQSKLAMA